MFLIPRNIPRILFGKIVFRSRLIRTNGTFDWYVGGKEIIKFLELMSVKKDDSILILGCGNSSLIKRDGWLVLIEWLL